jgi:hypothetical protein
MFSAKNILYIVFAPKIAEDTKDIMAKSFDHIIFSCQRGKVGVLVVSLSVTTLVSHAH